MIDKTDCFDPTTHMLCWSCAMCFSAAASSENAQGSMNFASNTASVRSTRPSSVAAIQERIGVLHPALDVLEDLTGVRLVPAPIQRFGHDAELDDEVARQIF